LKPTNAEPVFAATRWTLVLQARGNTAQARAALSDLCTAYYEPVFRFLRRENRDEDAARELTQAFFARLLQRGEVGGADPARGRFRSYLLGAVKHFLADLRKHEHREKRGGGAALESLDAPGGDAKELLEPADPADSTSDLRFDREWALAVMNCALNAVETEFAANDKGAQFEHLKPWLIGDTPELSQAEVARQLELNESAVRVAIHRMRRRFRELIRSEITQTLAAGEDADTELRYLIEVLAKS
jgi:RNA polymerase sigma-70 factor (ECF subfamily)